MPPIDGDRCIEQRLEPPGYCGGSDNLDHLGAGLLESSLGLDRSFLGRARMSCNLACPTSVWPLGAEDLEHSDQRVLCSSSASPSRKSLRKLMVVGGHVGFGSIFSALT
jgi:hypothetical protein